MRTNHVFLEDEDVFVQRLLATQGPYPTYFNEMAAINRLGTPVEPPPVPQIVPLAELATRAANGEWVLDLRHRHDFARSHVAASISFDASGAYVSYIGWLIPWQSIIHVIASDQGMLDTAITELARIGIESVESAAFWGDGSLSSDHMVSGKYADARRLRGALADDRELRVLDVRLPAECNRGTIAGELGVPVHELLERIDEIADWSGGREVWVYCASGFRAAVAASMLARAGVPAVAVDGSVVDS
jgi:rhodanese-related sulfurtransferase